MVRVRKASRREAQRKRDRERPGNGEQGRKNKSILSFFQKSNASLVADLKN
ncbi:hypothetical protein NSTCB13_00137 [Nostoc sp. DSM 114160]|jgi:hypothetical protein